MKNDQNHIITYRVVSLTRLTLFANCITANERIAKRSNFKGQCVRWIPQGTKTNTTFHPASKRYSQTGKAQDWSRGNSDTRSTTSSKPRSRAGSHLPTSIKIITREWISKQTRSLFHNAELRVLSLLQVPRYGCSSCYGAGEHSSFRAACCCVPSCSLTLTLPPDLTPDKSFWTRRQITAPKWLGKLHLQQWVYTSNHNNDKYRY